METTPQTAPGQRIKTGSGLSIGRYFTTAGSHPFDAVEWELRDARIGHGDRVAFEQRDVEFPKSWSQNATNIVAQKYFRGHLGQPEREYSVKQMIGRVAGTIAGWGRERGYFASEQDADAFEHELTHILLHQMAAFNSPVWFNVGFEERPQCSACFILSVQDNMESILDWNTREGMIFRGGSGSGINLSNIRGSNEPLAKGGTASGPVSFMRGADSWAGTIKSGGKTRRAAKMVVLDVDHPDIREFIWCKAKEEDKAAALRDAGFDMSIDGEGFFSIQYQNANNSVRVTDEFMRAVENDDEWRLIARTTGEPTGEPVRARDLMREIAEAAWRCADPGVQYDTTINQWHTCPNSGRINASNPCCFVGGTRVKTDAGDLTFDELYASSVEGKQLPRAEAIDIIADVPVMREIQRIWVAGMASRLSTVELDDGTLVKCTPEHRFLTMDGRWLAAEQLRAGTQLRAIAEQMAGRSASLVAVLAAVSVKRIVTEDLREPVPVFDMQVAEDHNFVVAAADGKSGVVVHNSEYMHVDDSACNLASLNLMKFRNADGTFEVESFEHAVDIVLLAQEIIVSPSSYPTEQIARNARAFRQLGLGYANLGAYLMSNGMPYDSDVGRGAAAAVTALMTGRAYAESARIAAAMGPYDRYAENREPHNQVMAMHREAAYAIPDVACHDESLLAAARQSWDEAVELGGQHGYRNAQSSTLAPTGTISFLMDCDTTGIEPDFSLVKFKELVGGGQMTIVNRTVPLALQTLGYSDEQVDQIDAYVAEHGTVIGAPGLAEEHLPVFDVAVGERAISHTGHLKMMGATQPFISGAISKCVSGDTLVASERGLLRIDSLHRGERADSFREMDMRIASLDGPRNTDAFYFGGVRAVREVKLRSGHRVIGTPNHRVLTCGADGLAWRRLDEVTSGEFVATQYGDDLWSAKPARFDDFTPSAPYGSQKDVTIPGEMDAGLAFWLGAYAAEGHVSRTTWTVVISNADEEVIPLIAEMTEAVFGCQPRVVRQQGKCPSIQLSSKRVVEFLDYLGCGDRACNKRIPDAILRSPKAMVLRFLDGLCLDAYITMSGMAKWAICLDSEGLLDDLQAILTNLGVVHGRTTKQAPLYDKTFDEVYAAGREAQRLVSALHFVEPHKALRAEEICTREFGQSTADVVPGITGPELYELLPRGLSGRTGKASGHSRTFSYLKDVRTRDVSRTSIERVATIEETELPEWLDVVLERNLHFSPVVSIEDAGERPVYDVSVPVTHAFVANGIVNHNTVNLPETATVDDIADAYVQAWHLGIKALAIYRDGSKTAQALRTDAQKDAPAPANVEEAIEQAVSKALAEAGPQRKRMPRERQSITHKFSIGGHEGYITAGMYEDGSVGEIFLTDIGKEGSTLRGMMNSFATAISIALQYGVPLETLVQKFSYMRFEPEGITGNPEIPFAKSMPDYIMRWVASRFLDADAQEELGILTPAVRARQAAQQAALSIQSSDTAGPANTTAGADEPESLKASNGGNGSSSKSPETPSAPAASSSSAAPADPPTAAFTDSPPVVPTVLEGLDLGPACSQCGGMMQRTGSCYTCSSCGNNTGCG
jgi:ribonucleotide reductase alpha subunit